MGLAVTLRVAPLVLAAACATRAVVDTGDDPDTSESRDTADTDGDTADTDTDTDTGSNPVGPLDLAADAKFVGTGWLNRSIRVGGPGDANQDGRADPLVSDALWQACVEHGPVVGIVAIPMDCDAAFDFPYAGYGDVAWTGDVDADGFDDVLIGSPDSSRSEADWYVEGAAFLVRGPISGTYLESDAVATMYGEVDPTWGDKAWDEGWGAAETGYSVAAVGDMDGDGYADLAIGAPDAAAGPGYERTGAAYLVRGPVGGSMDLGSDSDARITASVDGGSSVGVTLDGVGDTDGDGLDDLVVGQFESEGGIYSYGVVFRWPVAPDVTTAEADTSFRWTHGFATVPAGDSDGDGYADLWHYYGIAGEIEGGEAFLVPGPMSGDVDVGTAAVAQVYGDLADTWSGVADAGDVDGDGSRDVFVGVDNGPGIALLHLGPITGSRQAIADADVRIDGQNGDRIIHGGLTGDVDGDGLDDFVITGPGDDDGGDGAGAAWVVSGATWMSLVEPF